MSQRIRFIHLFTRDTVFEWINQDVYLIDAGSNSYPVDQQEVVFDTTSDEAAHITFECTKIARRRPTALVIEGVPDKWYHAQSFHDCARFDEDWRRVLIPETL